MFSHAYCFLKKSFFCLTLKWRMLSMIVNTIILSSFQRWILKYLFLLILLRHCCLINLFFVNVLSISMLFLFKVVVSCLCCNLVILLLFFCYKCYWWDKNHDIVLNLLPCISSINTSCVHLQDTCLVCLLLSRFNAGQSQGLFIVLLLIEDYAFLHSVLKVKKTLILW